MKKIVLIAVLILICMLLVGCSSIPTRTITETNFGMGMVIMPDGSIIKGKCEAFQRISGNWAVIKIDGTVYAANDWRIVRWNVND